MATAPAMSPSALPIEPVLDRVTGPRREEADEIMSLCADISDHKPVVWAGRILGFGQVSYVYESGRTGIMPVLAFAPGPKRHTLYLTDHFAERWPDLLTDLGPHTSSVACLYFTRLAPINRATLRQLLERSRDTSLQNNKA